MKLTKLKKEQLESKRFCVACNKDTIWIYNKNICHSECEECGCRYARKTK